MSQRQPNIICILTDDLGYGDISCYNPESKFQTPNIDRLARCGIRYTDAHAASAVCSPSRYSFMTGRYCWRTPKKYGTTATFAGPLITQDQLTMAGMLKRAGYSTACIGKWHMGLSFARKDGTRITDPNDPLEDWRQVDLDKPVECDPTTLGFDYFYGCVACPTDAPLYAYMENDRILGHPDIEFPGREGFMTVQRPGLMSREFDTENTDLIFLEHSRDWVHAHRQQEPDKPYFLFHAMQAPHCPILPAKQFQGMTEEGPYGDFVCEIDWIVGQLCSLAREDPTRETLIVFTSDNGPEQHTLVRRHTTGHDSAYSLRGIKRDNWEGGHRVPFVAAWEGIRNGGRVCETPICLTDLLATCAELVDVPLAENEAEDSESFLATFEDRPWSRPVPIIHDAVEGGHGLREGEWKFLNHSGPGWNCGAWDPEGVTYTDQDAPGQLYNIREDLGERENLYYREPERVERMRQKLWELEKGDVPRTSGI